MENRASTPRRRGSRSLAASEFAHHVSLLLLHQLASAQLPVSLFSGVEVDQLRVLQLAGHVKATIPLPVRTLSGYDQPPATVEAVTPLGRRMLRRFPRVSEEAADAPAAKAPRKLLLGRF